MNDPHLESGKGFACALPEKRTEKSSKKRNESGDCAGSLVLSRRSGEQPLLKHGRRQPVQDGVGSDGVVEGLDIGKDGSLCVTSGLKTVQM